MPRIRAFQSSLSESAGKTVHRVRCVAECPKGRSNAPHIEMVLQTSRRFGSVAPVHLALNRSFAGGLRS